MSVTPQTNTTLEEIAEALKQRDNICICGHISPDGDCLGSQLALAHALRAQGKTVTCLLARDEAPDAHLSFLPGFDRLVWAGAFEGECDTFVAVDTPTPSRLGDAAQIQQAASFTITIDHHAVDDRMSTLSYTDADIAATCQLVWELCGMLGERDSALATCTYTGLMTDTGRFQFQNSDERAFADAAAMVAAGANPADIACCIYQNNTLASVFLEQVVISHMELLVDGQVAISWVSLEDMERVCAQKSDTEALIDVLRSIEGVRVACILREQVDEVRGSLRAKDDTDVAAIARAYGGGGHTAAAGFTFFGTLADARKSVEEHILAALGA